MTNPHSNVRLLTRVGIVFLLLGAGVVFTGALAHAATPRLAHAGAGYRAFSPMVAHQIYITYTAGGVITPGAGWYEEGSTAVFTITPNTGYRIVEVRMDGNWVGTPTYYTFTNITAPHFLTASFTLNTYRITATTGPSGTIAPAGVSTVTYASNKVFTITPNLYHHIENLWVDGVLQPYNQVSTRYTFTNILAHHTLSATFAADPTTLYMNVVNSDTAVQGQVVFPGGSLCNSFCANFYFGTPTLVITAAINKGKFLHWDGACNGTGMTCSLQMVTTRTITAYFGLHQVYLPLVTTTSNLLEAAPNTALVEVNGPLRSDLIYTPRPNKLYDGFYFEVPTADPIALNMTNYNLTVTYPSPPAR